jgi:indolepyruvate ferredoxin oxidoreductase beta subunit
MKQQIIVSGLGGQGVVTLTRLLAEAAMILGWPVLASETHGMAQRGGTVISMVKVGPFKSPLVPPGGADVGLFLCDRNLPLHRPYVRPGGALVVNTALSGDYLGVDALGLTTRLGLAPVTANFVVLGFAVGRGLLFCTPEVFLPLIRENSPPRFREGNERALLAGLKAAEESSPA